MLKICIYNPCPRIQNVPFIHQVTGFDGILQSSGFIPPGKKYGQLEVYNIENGNGPWDIASKSQDGKDWAYHWAIWKDVDNDGLEDCITARYI